MAGLLDTNARDALAAQIRAQYGGSGGGSGNWDDAGVDRAKELADLLINAGVTSLGDLSFVDTPWTQAARSVETGSNGQVYDAPEMTGTNRQLKIGDKTVGFLGDYNNDGTFGSKSSEYLKSKAIGDTGEENLLGWSARGDGNTAYRVITDPNTGKLVIAPGWNSSSDASKFRNAAIAAGAMYAIPAAAEYMLASGAAGGLGATEGGAGLLADYGVGGATLDSGATGWGLTQGAGAAGGGIAGGSGLSAAGGGTGLSAGGTTAGGAATGLGTTGLGGAASGVGSAAGLLGAAEPYVRAGLAVAGAVDGYKGNDAPTTTVDRKLDPRIDSRVFGQGGLMENVDQWYQANKSGQNQTMIDAQNMQRGLLTDPALQQRLQQMANSGQGLMSAPVAANPWINWKPRG